MLMLSEPPAERHTLWEDAFGLVLGCMLMALSVQFLRASDLITGQIAGLSLVVSYPTGLAFGAVFFTLNLPFYVLAVRQMGWRFTLKTFAAVALMSAFTEILPRVLIIAPAHPLISAAGFGVCAGVGLLILFRHGATLGGVGIVALWLQDTRGIKAGNVQLSFDLCVFALALFLFDWRTVLYSLIGAALVNVMITVNHRRDRYIARS
ncbi:YitT family protein [Tropicibacter naphthalenivorans]|uniref:YitT family protein n=1 Tax=Tropicibacter naphthalenivorans TaxID=441103 RepID=A0A0P1GP70_9RHOB|nr:YitT family protein [Tropicibacter naphthalenivorans]CUH77471.1 hypothetical protein TRN7648_01492 [Tropicibacter naphthalenivorans]SMC57183.1 Uncharacterised 5xTM membrane BCR, YitT family COG1284 [Tropicibacter naphthalenivorans]